MSAVLKSDAFYQQVGIFFVHAFVYTAIYLM